MLKKLLFTSALITGMASGLPEAMAQGVCGDRDRIVSKLSADLGEVRVDGAAAGATSFYEFFASESTRTWTVLLSGVNGVSCVMAVGQDWQRPVVSSTRTSDGWPRVGALAAQ